MWCTHCLQSSTKTDRNQLGNYFSIGTNSHQHMLSIGRVYLLISTNAEVILYQRWAVSPFVLSSEMANLQAEGARTLLPEQRPCLLNPIQPHPLRKSPIITYHWLGIVRAREWSRGILLMHIYIWLCIHSSSASSFAELRLPGSHCSILRMNCKNASLSPFPSRVVSLFSSGTRSVNKSGVRKAPGVI